jgi:hypothetical protein
MPTRRGDKRGRTYSLSLWERAGVRASGAREVAKKTGHGKTHHESPSGSTSNRIGSPQRRNRLITLPQFAQNGLSVLADGGHRVHAVVKRIAAPGRQ